MQRTFIDSVKIIWLVCLSLGLICMGAAAAQTTSLTSASSVPARDLIRTFEQSTGARVAVAGDMDLSTPVAVPPQGFANRGQEMDTVAAALNAQWRKVYVVTPSDYAHPTVDVAAARRFTEGMGRVSFDANSLPASSAIAAVAQADNAGVDIAPGVERKSVSLVASGLTVPQAIALVSRETGTSWSLAYRLEPLPVNYTSAVVASADLIPRRTFRPNYDIPIDPRDLIPGYYEPFAFTPTPTPVITTTASATTPNGAPTANTAANQPVAVQEPMLPPLSSVEAPDGVYLPPAAATGNGPVSPGLTELP